VADFELQDIPAAQLPSAKWAAALLYALARDEAAGRLPARLTETRLGTWSRFRGRLTATDFAALLFEDAAVIHPVPFDASRFEGLLNVELLPEAVTQRWLDSLSKTDLTESGANYIEEQARLLGLPTRLARSDLHVVKPHQKVLELPHTGGQLGHHLVSIYPGLTLQENFVVACSSWQELVMAGIVALDRGAPRSDFAMGVSSDELRNASHPIRQRAFDFVVGLHPDKGGAFGVEDQLAIWFPTAKILLV
jgi:hypothetical protein